jgi:hypothetical protein
MPIDLIQNEKITKFEKYFNIVARKTVPTASDYYKLWVYGLLVKNIRQCPVCGEQSTYTAEMPRRQSVCKNKHSWHICLTHRKISIGEVSDKVRLDKCTCEA